MSYDEALEIFALLFHLLVFLFHVLASQKGARDQQGL